MTPIERYRLEAELGRHISWKGLVAICVAENGLVQRLSKRALQ